MNVLIVGSTGRTGAHLLRQALEQGHQVTALARNPDRIENKPAGVRYVKGDILSPATLDAATQGQQAVLAAVASRSLREAMAPSTLFTDGAKNLLAAMERKGVSRFVFVTSGGVERDDPGHNLFLRWIFLPLFHNLYDDARAAETAIRQSSLEWTIVRGPLLVDGPLTGRYRVSPRFMPPQGSKISRADLAHFMLAQLSDRQHLRGTPTIAY